MEPKSPRSARPAPRQEVKIIAFGILLILLIGAYFFGRTTWQDKLRNEADYQNLVGEGSQEPEYPTIAPEALQKMASTPEEKFTIIDIRSQEEYTLSHIPNSLSYPDATVTTVNLPNTNKVIVVGSEDEELNTDIAKYLEDRQISFAFVKGGYTAWTQLHQPVVTMGNPNSFVDQSKIKYVSPEELKKRFQAGENIFVLDVQPREAFQAKHLKDAKNIPLEELESRIGELPGGQKIVVYGTNETRAFQAGIILFDLNIFGAEVISGDQVLDSGLFTEGQ